MTKKELNELKSIRNDLVLIARELPLGRAYRSQLISMSVVLERMCVNNGAVYRPQVEPLWPDTALERWEAGK